jgi:hypothetical protein
LRRQWRWRRSRQFRHGIERPVGHLQLVENELLQIGIGLSAACPMSLEDRAGDAIDHGLKEPRPRSRPEATRNTLGFRCRRKPIGPGCRKSNIPCRPAGLPDLGAVCDPARAAEGSPISKADSRKIILAVSSENVNHHLAFCTPQPCMTKRSLGGETVRTPDDGAPAFMESRSASPMNFCTVFFIGRAPSAL